MKSCVTCGYYEILTALRWTVTKRPRWFVPPYLRWAAHITATWSLSSTCPRLPVGEPSAAARLQRSVAMCNDLKSAAYVLGLNLLNECHRIRVGEERWVGKHVTEGEGVGKGNHGEVIMGGFS